MKKKSPKGDGTLEEATRFTKEMSTTASELANARRARQQKNNRVAARVRKHFDTLHDTVAVLRAPKGYVAVFYEPNELAEALEDILEAAKDLEGEDDGNET